MNQQSEPTKALGDMKLIVDMPLEDQKLINHFSRIHQHYMNLKTTSEALKNRLERLNDADEEVEMWELEAEEEEGTLMTVFGTGFVPSAVEDTKTFVERLRERLNKQIDDFNVEMIEVKKMLKKISDELGTKYGGALRMDVD